MNTAYFLPEARAGCERRPLPSEDAETLERLLALEPWPEPVPPSRERSARRAPEEIDAHWRGEPADEATYRARWSSSVASTRSSRARSAT